MALLTFAHFTHYFCGVAPLMISFASHSLGPGEYRRRHRCSRYFCLPVQVKVEDHKFRMLGSQMTAELAHRFIDLSRTLATQHVALFSDFDSVLYACVAFFASRIS